MNILIVDDEAMHRALLEDIFSTWPEHKITVVDNGQAALDLLKANGHRFDIIFLDINMPGLSGLQVLERLRESPLHRSLQVVMCTTLDDTATMTKAAALGARYYMVKPCTVKGIAEKLRQIASSADFSVS